MGYGLFSSNSIDFNERSNVIAALRCVHTNSWCKRTLYLSRQYLELYSNTMASGGSERLYEEDDVLDLRC